jgi:mediator of RNA polymerase II transcription subunit 22
MKLLLLLSDESQIAKRRDTELKAVQADKEETKRKVAALLDEFLNNNPAQSMDSQEDRSEGNNNNMEV